LLGRRSVGREHAAHQQDQRNRHGTATPVHMNTSVSLGQSQSALPASSCQGATVSSPPRRSRMRARMPGGPMAGPLRSPGPGQGTSERGTRKSALPPVRGSATCRSGGERIRESRRAGDVARRRRPSHGARRRELARAPAGP
jgi:hypothetical protein